ncbi:hypothetical protein JCM8097_007131 [Rhodosporidiobolus ruineniae]
MHSHRRYSSSDASTRSGARPPPSALFGDVPPSPLCLALSRISSHCDAPDSAVDLGDSGRRNLVLFFDGTGNQFGPTTTNIPTLFSMCELNPKKQLVYYQTGIGTSIATWESPFTPSKIVNRVAQILDTGIAWSLGTHVQKGYEFLMNCTSSLGGFPRGAFTARALAGMVQQVGLLPAGNEETVPLAYSIYKKAAATPLTPTETLAQGFKRTFSRSVEIEFVGVFDTVSSVGALWPKTLPFAAGSRTTHHFRQALALDECRARYNPQPWVPDNTDDKTVVKEVWFAGSHSDVGGGEFPYDGDATPSLSHPPLRWMLREAVEQGLSLDAARVEASPLFAPYMHGGRQLVRAFRMGTAPTTLTDQGISMTKAQDYLKQAEEKNPDVDPVAAASVYLSSLALQAPNDALAPRANHLSFRFEAPSSTFGFIATLRNLASRVRQCGIASWWWLLELSPTPKVVWDADGKRTRWKIRANLGQSRLLPSSPFFHHSVRTRYDAPASALHGQGNNANYPEGPDGYKPMARFRRGEGCETVRWAE